MTDTNIGCAIVLFISNVGIQKDSIRSIPDSCENRAGSLESDGKPVF